MLMKLFKHEFRATGRIMGPIYLLLLASAIGANVSFRGLLDSGNRIFNLLGGLLTFAFVFAIIAVCLAAFVLMVQRFYKNLLQDEGYVMLTLPVSIHQHIWTKLTVSAVWFAATLLAVVLASCIAAFDIRFLGEFFRGLSELFREVLHLRPVDVTNIVFILAELLVLAFLGTCGTCLQFYASLSIGHSAAGHKLAWSVAAYLIIQFVQQLLGGLAMIFLDAADLGRFLPESWHLSLGDYGAIHLIMLFIIVAVVIQGAIFYLVTVWFMKRRLNLE